jgi:hypothetical protein
MVIKASIYFIIYLKVYLNLIGRLKYTRQQESDRSFARARLKTDVKY